VIDKPTRIILVVLITSTAFFSFGIVRAFATLDHKTFEKCWKRRVPKEVRDALGQEVKQAIENESINYNSTYPNPNDTIAVATHDFDTQIHACMVLK
jgi:hypothetical protein